MRTMARKGSTKIACTSNAFLESEEEWIKQLGIELLKDGYYFSGISRKLCEN